MFVPLFYEASGASACSFGFIIPVETRAPPCSGDCGTTLPQERSITSAPLIGKYLWRFLSLLPIFILIPASTEARSHKNRLSLPGSVSFLHVMTALRNVHGKAECTARQPCFRSGGGRPSCKMERLVTVLPAPENGLHANAFFILVLIIRGRWCRPVRPAASAASAASEEGESPVLVPLKCPIAGNAGGNMGMQPWIPAWALQSYMKCR